MNAGAYGGDLAGVLERALVVAADGSGWLTPAELGLSYRHSGLHHGQVVARAELRLAPRPVDEIKATVSDMQARRKAAQPTNKRTFGSVFKNPDHELSAGRMLEACGLRGFAIGGAQISPRHANFIENAGGATSADAIALMAEARRRALRAVRRHARARGGVPRRARAAAGGDGRTGRVGAADAEQASVETRRARPARRPAAAPARVVAAPRRVDVSRFVPSTRSVLAGVALLLSGMIAFAVARQSSLFAIRSIEVVGAKPALEQQVRDALQPLVGTSLVALDRDQVQKRLDALPQIRRASYDRAFPNTLRVVVEPDLPAAVLRSGPDGWLISEYGAVLQKLTRPFPKNLPGIWITPEDAPTARIHEVPARITVALRGLAEARRSQSALLPQIGKVKAVAGRPDARAALAHRAPLGDARDLALKLAVANRVLQTLSADERKQIRYLDLTLPSRPVTGQNPQL